MLSINWILKVDVSNCVYMVMIVLVIELLLKIMDLSIPYNSITNQQKYTKILV